MNFLLLQYFSWNTFSFHKNAYNFDTNPKHSLESTFCYHVNVW